MQSLLAGLSLLTWVVFSIFANGIAALHRFTKLRGLGLIGYGASLGILLHALVGAAIAAAPTVRWVFVAVLIGLTLASTIYFAFRNILRELSLALSIPTKVSLALWFLLLVISLGILHLDVRFPRSLPDGLYISKSHTTNVKVQYLTGLPADNYTPFAVAEFFLRGVSFKEQRPILPGNEVTNRTILMSLASLPFRVALGAPHNHPHLGTYSYLGREWPDVWKLNTGDYFEQFVVVGVVLNSLLLIGLLVFCSSIGAASILPLATLLYITNPYFLSETIYTWPKPLAGFFILLSWSSIRSGHGPMVVAVLLALAYHCHPYAIVFAGFVALFYLARCRREASSIRATLLYLAVFSICVGPWFFWTRFVLHIPSDLIAQNVIGPGTEAALASSVNFVWIRVQNLFCLLTPMMFAVYPFNLAAVIDNWLSCLPGAVGVIVVYPGLSQCRLSPGLRPWLWYGLIGPALALVAVFSGPALPVLHGYQPLAGVLLFFGVWWLSQRSSRAVYFGLAGLQLAINLFVVLARGYVVGVNYP